jgi:hypothetical protein
MGLLYSLIHGLGLFDMRLLIQLFGLRGIKGESGEKLLIKGPSGSLVVDEKIISR